MAKLNHPNIVHIYTLGCVDGIRFIAMEYVQGTNLRDYIVKKGALDLALALSIMKQAGVAIGAAGELGLVHRDIKPENLLLTKKGQVKIADFGLCRDQDADRPDLTQPGVTLGTPLYMSPEQAQGHALDHRSDLYSLGVTFYHMLAGEPPFRAETALALALKHVKDTPVSLAVHRPDLPPDLVALVMKLIAKDPDERYQSAAEMLRDLAQAPWVAEHDADHGEPSPTLSPVGRRRDRRRSATQRQGHGAAANAAAAAACGLGLAVAVVWRTSSWAGGVLGGLVVLGLLAGLVLRLARTSRGPALGACRGTSSPAFPPSGWRPNGSRLPGRPAAEEQYHYAQLRASRADQEAAWIAVPGYFPTARAWASQAYIQLARVLLPRHDAERLRIFATEIDRWNAAQEHEQELVTIIQAAAKALDGDQEGAIRSCKSSISPRPSIRRSWNWRWR